MSSATPTLAAPAAGRKGRTAGRRWRRRWYRAVVPFAVFGLLVTVTLVARFQEEPDLSRSETLSPAGTGEDGASELARLLADRGVRVDHVTDVDAAVAAAGIGEDSVVFVPRPTSTGMQFASHVRSLPGDYRLVLVAPNTRQLSATGVWWVQAESSRWATRDAAPGCEVPEAVEAGRAAAVRSRYAVAFGDTCYDRGLVRTEFGATGTELFVVGSADPFRNRRIHEHGNAALAVGLLSGYDRVIWLGALPFEPDPPPEFDPPEFDPPEIDAPEIDAPDRGEGDRAAGDPIFGDLAGNYGPAAPAALVLAVLLAVLVALAMARRLGNPVSEPLPVVVPAAEAVAGRGRLYQRTRDQAVAMAALRTAAVRRLAVATGLPATPPPEPDVLVEAVVARTGLPEGDVRRTLYGPAPTTDEQLTELVTDLDALVEAVTREGGPS